MTALTRLQTGYYNSEPVSEANPGGFGDGGHVVNFPAALADIATVAADIVVDAEAVAAAAGFAEAAEEAAEEAALIADGRTVRSGAAVPDPGLGRDGDFYIKTPEFLLYGPKAAGAWGAGVPMIGEDGEDGEPVVTYAAVIAALGFTPADDADLANKADLAFGLIPTEQLPAIAITDTFEVASQAAMLALTAQRGDVAVRTDEGKSYILSAEPATTLANWKWLRTPTDAVLSVAGLTGAVSAAGLKAALALVKGDVGLGNVDNTSDVNKPVSTAQQAALDLKHNVADKASAAEVRTGTNDTKHVTAKGLHDAAAPVALTDAATIAVDLDSGLNFSLTLAGNRTLGAPTNATAGQSGLIVVRQDATGNRTLAYNAAYKRAGGALTLSTGANAIDVLSYYVTVGGGSPEVLLSLAKGFA